MSLLACKMSIFTLCLAFLPALAFSQDLCDLPFSCSTGSQVGFETNIPNQDACSQVILTVENSKWKASFRPVRAIRDAKCTPTTRTAPTSASSIPHASRTTTAAGTASPVSQIATSPEIHLSMLIASMTTLPASIFRVQWNLTLPEIKTLAHRYTEKYSNICFRQLYSSSVLLCLPSWRSHLHLVSILSRLKRLRAL